MGDTPISEERPVLRFSQLLPGLLSVSWRLPKIIGAFREFLKFDDNSPVSLGTVLEENARKFGSKPAILFEDRSINHAEFNQATNRYGNYFHAQNA